MQFAAFFFIFGILPFRCNDIKSFKVQAFYVCEYKGIRSLLEENKKIKINAYLGKQKYSCLLNIHLTLSNRTEIIEEKFFSLIRSIPFEHTEKTHSDSLEPVAF